MLSEFRGDLFTLLFVKSPRLFATDGLIGVGLRLLSKLLDGVSSETFNCIESFGDEIFNFCEGVKSSESKGFSPFLTGVEGGSFKSKCSGLKYGPNDTFLYFSV